MSSSDRLFEMADFAIIRKAKNHEVKVKEVTNGVIIFDIEGVEVTAKKDERGYLYMHCLCDFCSQWSLRHKEKKKGLYIINKILCSRQIAAYWHLIKRNGRISEVETAWQKSSRLVTR